ncbi:MAG: ABC transporter substrate-binding protein [Chloroflexi bacterium]|nr:ABC transporter substrate-binding protein [Chloroflexota bacterium]
MRDFRGKEVAIKATPQALIADTLGLAEVTHALVPVSRIRAAWEGDILRPTSNIREIAARVPLRYASFGGAGGTEEIIAFQPDLIVFSQFIPAEKVQLIEEAGVTVVVSGIRSSVEDYKPMIRFLAYVYGEEANGEQLIAEIERRIKVVTAVTEKKREAEKPRVLYLDGGAWANGADTGPDAIIRYAGAINPAAKAGIKGSQQVGVESIVALSPDYIIVNPEGTDGAKRQELLTHLALGEVPAIKNGRLVDIHGRYIRAISHWAVRGLEELAKILWPDDFKGVEFKDFVYRQ